MNAIATMQEWYASHCDGDWEHDRRIRISTIDNPGWSLSVNLVGTELEDRAFTRIEREHSDIQWLHCWVSDGVFEGRCGATQLVDLITEFVVWACASAGGTAE